MKKGFHIVFFAAACVFLFTVSQPAHAASISERLAGRILLQVEEHGEAWYVNPDDGQRYYLGRPQDAWYLMRSLGLGISSDNIAKIPISGTAWDGDARLMPYVRGKILLEVEKNGEAWYVNPADSRRYYLGRPADAFRIMSSLGLGISNTDLDAIPVSNGEASAIQLHVPFTSQAPYGNWNPPYDEACEEAVLAMVDAYFRGQPLSADEANTKITELVNWQKANFGDYEDTGMIDTGTMAREVFGYDFYTSRHVTVDTIKEELLAGNPVIVPVSGQDLHNRSFRGAGPLYHVLVITGFTSNMFITNEPGTRNGGGYQYEMNLLVDAIHDLTDPESNIRGGLKRYLIIRR